MAFRKPLLPSCLFLAVLLAVVPLLLVPFRRHAGIAWRIMLPGGRRASSGSGPPCDVPAANADAAADFAYVQSWLPPRCRDRVGCGELPPLTESAVHHAVYDEATSTVVLLGQNLRANPNRGVLHCIWQSSRSLDAQWHLSAASEVTDWVARCDLPPSHDCEVEGTGERKVVGWWPVSAQAYCADAIVSLVRVPTVDVDDAVSYLRQAGATAVPLHSNARAPRPRPRLVRPDGAEAHALHLLCAVTIVRDEAPFLLEWVDYHRQLGVSMFLVLDNDSRDATPNVLARLAARGVHRLYWPFRKSQAAAYALARLLTSPICEFAFFMDVDQFITVGEGDPPSTLHGALRRAAINSSVSQVCLRSKAFLSAGLVSRPDAPVVSSYVRARPALEMNPNCAVVAPPIGAVPGVLLDSRIHYFQSAPGHVRVTLDPGEAIFNHYTQKSWQDYIRKYDGRIGLVKDWAPLPPNVSAGSPPWNWELAAGDGAPDSSVVAFRDRLYAACGASVVWGQSP